MLNRKENNPQITTMAMQDKEGEVRSKLDIFLLILFTLSLSYWPDPEAEGPASLFRGTVVLQIWCILLL